MKFSIVTPSFRNSSWLKLCIASVADQSGVDVEHIVQDSCSDDGTQDWLPKDPRVKAFIEKDAGMYDAVNRGWKRASGELLAYLNCDEQYLPGGLKAVADHFAAHPELDVLFADTVVVQPDGSYICSRKSLVPWRNVMWIYTPVITSSTFMRRRVLDEHKIFFDTKWRDLGDFFWQEEVMRRRLNVGFLRHFTSSFTDTGENMNLKPNAIREKEKKLEMYPAWVRRFQWPLFQLHRARMVLRGIYWQTPFTYSIYTPSSPTARVDFRVEKPTAVWWTRH